MDRAAGDAEVEHDLESGGVGNGDLAVGRAQPGRPPAQPHCGLHLGEAADVAGQARAEGGGAEASAADDEVAAERLRDAVVDRRLERTGKDGEQGDHPDPHHEGGRRARRAAGVAHGVAPGQRPGDAPEPRKRRAEDGAGGPGHDGPEHDDAHDREQGAQPSSRQHGAAVADHGGEHDGRADPDEGQPGDGPGTGGARPVDGDLAQGRQRPHPRRPEGGAGAGQQGDGHADHERDDDRRPLEDEPAGGKGEAEGVEEPLEEAGDSQAPEEPGDGRHQPHEQGLEHDRGQHLAAHGADRPHERRLPGPLGGDDREGVVDAERRYE